MYIIFIKDNTTAHDALAAHGGTTHIIDRPGYQIWEWNSDGAGMEALVASVGVDSASVSNWLGAMRIQI